MRYFFTQLFECHTGAAIEFRDFGISMRFSALANLKISKSQNQKSKIQPFAVRHHDKRLNNSNL
jgi:hypothetical protein